MDLSIVVFDLRDAIEELREERAELLKRIEALEASAPRPEDDEEQDQRHDAGSDSRVRSANRPKPRDSEKSQDHPTHENIDEDDVRDQLAEVVHSGILPRGGTR